MSSVVANDVRVFELPARVSGCYSDTDRLGRQLFQAAQGNSRLVLDFSRVQLVTAALLGVLLGVTRRSAARRGDIVLCGLGPFDREVLRIAHLEHFWPVYEDRAAALSSMAPAGEPVICEGDLLAVLCG